MKKKFLILAILLLASVFLVSLPCDKYLSCEGKAMDTLQYPGLWFLIMIPLGLLALTLNDQKHRSWLIFTGCFFVVSIIIVFLMPETAGGIMLNPDRESTNWFFAGLYSFISIIYFIVQFFKNRKNSK
jgi:magnesium-transporting ATPase (P-type)